MLLRSAILLGGLTLLGARCERVPVSGPPSPAVSPVGNAEIRMAASGFSPAVLRVAEGKTVTFRNVDTQPHWVASDPHPVHTGLPGFDARAPIPPGGTYTFTFSKSGRFPYHDHLNPGTRGEVSVVAQ